MSSLNLRYYASNFTLGLSNSQKRLIDQCHQRQQGQPLRVVREFKRVAAVNILQNLVVIPEPTRSKISSYLSYKRRLERGNVQVSC